jgi:hypothetical protein
MVAAAALGEIVALRSIYVVSGVIVSAGGLVGLAVLQEPSVPAEIHELAMAPPAAAVDAQSGE